MSSAFDHPLLSGLLGDAELDSAWGLEAEIQAMLAFEGALAAAQADCGFIPAEAAAAIADLVSTFHPDIDDLRRGTAVDGVVVPRLIAQMRAALGEPHAATIHVGATSQDVIDTAMVLRMSSCLVILGRRVEAINAALETLRQRFGQLPMMGVTRMQPAIGIHVADRIDAWLSPLARHLGRLGTLRNETMVVQFGGPAGSLDHLDGKGPEIRRLLAGRLGLGDVPQWQSQRDRIASLAGWLATLSGLLGKFGQDVALLAQMGGEIALSGGGKSSAMAHKQNPVQAEVLVALGRYAASLQGAMQQSLIHEQERSGAAWTLEWLALPQLLKTAGASTIVALRLAENIQQMGSS